MADLTAAVTGEDHQQGSADAAATLVEYGDYQCPDCGAAFKIVKQVQQHFGDKLRFVYRNFPLEMHPMAEPAAEAAEFAATQGKFWEMHDAIYEHQSSLSEAMLERTGEQLGLDRNRVRQAIEESEFEQRIEADMESGDQSDVQGTPTFFINGKQLTGSYDLRSLEQAIADEL